MHDERTTVGALLASYLIARNGAAFNWSTNHCCHFAGRWVEYATGIDYVAEFEVPSGPVAARRVIAKRGGSLQAIVTKALGTFPIAPTMAQTGDVMLLRTDLVAVDPKPHRDMTGEALGICSGRQVVVMDHTGVAHMLPIAFAECAWRINTQDNRAAA